MTTTINEEGICEITDILDYKGSYHVRYDISIKDIVFNMGPGFGYAKLFDELDVSAKNGHAIPHLISHNIKDSRYWPSVLELSEFGEKLGYQKSNIRDLLYFCLNIRDKKNKHQEINMCDVVSTGSETQIIRGIAPHHPMAPSGFSMSSLSKNAKCPRKIVVLMIEKV